MPGAVSAVIFDLDGTLIDSKEVMRHAYFSAYVEVVGDVATAPPFSEYCRYLGQSFPNIMLQMGLPVEMYPVFARESLHNIGKISLFDGVSSVLEELARRKIPMAIATGKDNGRATGLLRHLNIDHHFAIVVGSDDVAHQKPAPDMVVKIVDHLQLDPSETLFVGDAIADLICGRAGGVMTALAHWDDPLENALNEPVDFHFRHPTDLLSLLRESQECPTY